MGEVASLGTVNTINIPSFVLVVGGVLLFGIIVFLVSIIVYLSKKIRFLTKMRFGFGGRPIFSILAILAIALAIPLTYYASSRSIEIVNLARAERDVTIEVQKIEVYEGLYDVSFMAIPTVDGEAWGEKSYEITWMVEGPLTFEKKESERSIKAPSYFRKELPSGTYELKVVVESEGFKVVKTQYLDF
ncbi:hypothetical protein JW766_05045 [Candidatus Dojkabacteria bacterium]|nr:hypothetical protein [Candidatus Dojkabacteria bacterium]